MEKFKNNLKFLREKCGYSQGQLSQKLDIPKTSISRYEAQERKINSINLIKFASFFKVSPEYILGLKEKDTFSVINVKIKDDLKKEIIAFYNSDNISEKDKEEIFKILQEFYYRKKY